MKKVRRMLYMIMILAMAVSFAGCSGNGIGSLKDKKWIDESAEMISDEITSGEFVIDGVVYQFPMPLEDWLDNGWHISNSYDNVDEFRLKPYHTSSEFELINEDDAYVRVSVYNDSGKDASIEDCIVDHLYISTMEVDVVFPQGMTKRNKPDDVLEAYGEPDSTGDSTQTLEAVYYFSDANLGQCYVELNIFDNSYTHNPFTSINFGTLSSDDYWDDMVSEKGIEETAETFFDAAMKASFYADFTEYVSLNMDSVEGAKELYNNEVEYFTECLLYYIDITEAYITEDVRARVNEVSKQVLSKVKWEVKSVDVNSFREGTMTLILYPTDFFYVIEEGLIEASDAFYSKYGDVDYETISDEEYDALEKEYTETMVAVLEKYATSAGTLEAVEKVYKVDLDEMILPDDAWTDVDATLMDLVAEEE